MDPVGQKSWGLMMLVGGPGQDHQLIQRRENAGCPEKGPEGELREGGVCRGRHQSKPGGGGLGNRCFETMLLSKFRIEEC